MLNLHRGYSVEFGASHVPHTWPCSVEDRLPCGKTLGIEDFKNELINFTHLVYRYEVKRGCKIWLSHYLKLNPKHKRRFLGKVSFNIYQDIKHFKVQTCSNACSERNKVKRFKLFFKLGIISAFSQIAEQRIPRCTRYSGTKTKTISN